MEESISIFKHLIKDTHNFLMSAMLYIYAIDLKKTDSGKGEKWAYTG